MESSYSFVRKSIVNEQPPPLTQVGITGWLWRNLFSSMSNFSSISSSILSLLMISLTTWLLYFCGGLIYSFIDFAILSAVFTDPDGIKRKVCATVKQGGELPADWYGACWPFIFAKKKFLIYGRIPTEELWRANLVYAALVIGMGFGENFIASDQLALADFAENFVFLEEGDLAEISATDITYWDLKDKQVDRPVVVAKSLGETVDKGEYRHFMLKEINEQPAKIKGLLEGQLTESGVQEEIFGPNAPEIFKNVAAVQIVACGTSFHAGTVAKYWLEGLAGLPCSVEVASEFRYRNKVVAPNTLFVTISQSGETADTLACLSAAKDAGYLSRLGICNVPSSSLARESDLVFLTKAGPEIGVASTKAFTTQLVGLLMLTLILGRHHGLSSAAENTINNSLRALPDSLDSVMQLEDQIIEMAEDFDQKEHALFLGRGIHYPVAMEGALKLKEISYIHAEAYPAGELKHGPLALVDSEMPVVAVAPNDDLLEKLQSNLEEVRARGGKLYVFGHSEAHHNDESITKFIELPEVPELIAPLIYSIPLQLLAYHVAILKGTDIDQPRNLAKSVTVE